MPKDGSKLLKDQIKAGEKDLLRILSEAKGAVELKIKRMVKKGNFATAATVRESLYRGVVTEYIKLNRKFDVYVNKHGERVAKEWNDTLKDDLGDLSVALPTFGQFSEKYLNDIIERVNPSNADSRILLNARFGSMAKSDIDGIRAIVTDVFRIGAASGLTTKDMAEQMRSRILDFNPGLELFDKNGRRMNAESYFAMINRTITSTVARETYSSLSAEAGYDLMQIDGGITAGSLQPGDPCSRWAGKIVSMSGNTPGYPTYADALAAGVFHPNCVHTLSVVTPTRLPEAKEERKETAEEGREARKEVNEDRKEDGLKPIKFS